MSFKRHWCRVQVENAQLNKNTTWFTANAKCLHTTCSTYKFIVSAKNIIPYRDLKVTVFKDAEWCHEGERHRKFYKSEKRNAVKADLKLYHPCIKHYKMLQ